MRPELAQAVRSYKQWFGSYKKSGELKKVQVWLILNDGRIEFTTPTDSYKAKRVRRNPRAICFIGHPNGPAVPGNAEIVTDEEAVWRVYRAYWKTHPFMMLLVGLPIRQRIKAGKSVVVRILPDEPNPFSGLTDPSL